MPVPKRKRSRARRDKRFANKHMKVQAFSECNNCKAPLVPHTACKECGFYKGVKIFDTKLDRSIKRTDARKKQAKSDAAPVHQDEKQDDVVKQ